MSHKSEAFNFTDLMAEYIHARFIWHVRDNLGPQPIPRLFMTANSVIDCELLAQQAADAYRNPSEIS